MGDKRHKTHSDGVISINVVECEMTVSDRMGYRDVAKKYFFFSTLSKFRSHTQKRLVMSYSWNVVACIDLQAGTERHSAHTAQYSLSMVLSSSPSLVPASSTNYSIIKLCGLYSLFSSESSRSRYVFVTSCKPRNANIGTSIFGYIYVLIYGLEVFRSVCASIFGIDDQEQVEYTDN